MDLIARAFTYALEHQSELAAATGRHLLLVGVALAVAVGLGVPLGAAASRSQAVASTVLGLFNALRVIPSLAVLFLAIPYLGLTLTAALVALALLAVPPVLVNADAAFRSVDPAVREAALAVGMTRRQALLRVELPLAMPVLVAGVRAAAVEAVASATLAAFIGAGGLGVFVVRGFALYDPAVMLVGAVPVALLALASERALAALERATKPIK